MKRIITTLALIMIVYVNFGQTYQKQKSDTIYFKNIDSLKYELLYLDLKRQDKVDLYLPKPSIYPKNNNANLPLFLNKPYFRRYKY